jgi:hypothetical protein
MSGFLGQQVTRTTASLTKLKALTGTLRSPSGVLGIRQIAVDQMTITLRLHVGPRDVTGVRRPTELPTRSRGQPDRPNDRGIAMRAAATVVWKLEQDGQPVAPEPSRKGETAQTILIGSGQSCGQYSAPTW